MLREGIPTGLQVSEELHLGGPQPRERERERERECSVRTGANEASVSIGTVAIL